MNIICLMIYVFVHVVFDILNLKFCINWLKGNGYIGVKERKKEGDWQFLIVKLLSSTIYE